MTDAKGQLSTYTYNEDDSLAQVAYGNSSVATPTVGFSYEAIENPIVPWPNSHANQATEQPAAEDEGGNDAVDDGGKSCPSGELTPTGQTKTEPSTKKSNKGGTSVQEGYKDKEGRDVTRHTIYGPNGNVIEPPHFRPGGFK